MITIYIYIYIMYMYVYIYIYIYIYKFGSFYNAVILWIPKEEAFLKITHASVVCRASLTFGVFILAISFASGMQTELEPRTLKPGCPRNPQRNLMTKTVQSRTPAKIRRLRTINSMISAAFQNGRSSSRHSSTSSSSSSSNGNSVNKLKHKCHHHHHHHHHHRRRRHCNPRSHHHLFLQHH